MRRLLLLLAALAALLAVGAAPAYAQTADLGDPLPAPNYLPWVIVIAVTLILCLVVAAVAVGPDRFGRFWLWLPAPVRTWINVSVGAAVSAGLPLLVNALTELDLPAWVSVVLLPFATSAVRAINPADAAYGASSAEAVEQDEVPPTDGDHEAGQE